MSSNLSKRFYLAFFLLFLAWRTCFVLFSRWVYHQEEAGVGGVWALFHESVRLPLIEFIGGGYDGGRLLFGILASPVVALCHQWFALPCLGLKVIALLTASLCAVFTVIYVEKTTGTYAAKCTALLSLISVPYLVQMSLILWGNYPQSAMLSFLVYILLHQLLFEHRAEGWRYFLLGGLFGLGTWIHYEFLITVGVSMMFFLLVQPATLATRRFLFTPLGAVIGFSPWIIYNYNHDFIGYDRISGLFWFEPFDRYLSRQLGYLGDFLSVELPASLQLIVGDVTSTKIFAYSYYTVFLLLFLYLLTTRLPWINRNPMKHHSTPSEADEHSTSAALLLPTFFIAYLLIYSFSDIERYPIDWLSRDPLHHRFTFVLLPVMIGIIGQSLARLRKRFPGGATVLVMILAGFGLVGQIGMLSGLQMDQLRREFAAWPMLETLGTNCGMSRQDPRELLTGLDTGHRYPFAIGYGEGRVREASRRMHWQSLTPEACAKFETNTYAYCLLGFGTGLVDYYHLNLDQLGFVVNKLPKPFSDFGILGGAIAEVRAGNAGSPIVELARRIDTDSMPLMETSEPFNKHVQRFLRGSFGPVPE